MQEGFKIVELGRDGQPHALFHGTNGTRRIPVGEWVEAQIRDAAKDGTSKTTYRSGWHTLPTLKDAQAYLTKFKCRREKLRIYRCQVKDCWPKSHSPYPVTLSRHIKLLEEIQ